jgi:glycosyltransferase involved in cell wall biosynthesis
MKILYVYGDTPSEWNCSEHRITIPFRAMRRAGIPCESIDFQVFSNPVYEKDDYIIDADIIILQRNIFGPIVNKVSYLRAMGKTVLVDLDDAYHLMTSETGLEDQSGFWHMGIVTRDGKKTTINPTPITFLEWGVKLAGAVGTPSKVLCQDWVKFGVRTYYLPNYVDLRFYPLDKRPPYKEPGKIYIGGGGSLGHRLSWTKSGVQEALVRLLGENHNVTLVWTGDEKIQTFFKDIRPSQRVPMGWIPYASYARSLSILDLGIIPLAGEYDRRRSYIKPLEYATMGIPWVGTDMEPNRNKDLGTLVVPNTPEAWYDTLKSAVDNIGTLKQEAVARRQSIRETYSIDARVPEIIKTYEKVIKESK